MSERKCICGHPLHIGRYCLEPLDAWAFGVRTPFCGCFDAEWDLEGDDD